MHMINAAKMLIPLRLKSQIMPPNKEWLYKVNGIAKIEKCNKYFWRHASASKYIDILTEWIRFRETLDYTITYYNIMETWIGI